jgi:hypothetical protein
MCSNFVSRKISKLIIFLDKLKENKMKIIVKINDRLLYDIEIDSNTTLDKFQQILQEKKCIACYEEIGYIKYKQFTIFKGDYRPIWHVLNLYDEERSPIYNALNLHELIFVKLIFKDSYKKARL